MTTRHNFRTSSLIVSLIFIILALFFLIFLFLTNNELHRKSLIFPTILQTVVQKNATCETFENCSHAYNFPSYAVNSQHKLKFYESSRLSLVTDKPSLMGCVNRTELIMNGVGMTSLLTFEPIDCSLFCVGRNFSRVNLRNSDQLSSCFCSNEWPTLRPSKCEVQSTNLNIFKSYKLSPIKLPTLKVKFVPLSLPRFNYTRLKFFG